MQKSYVTKSPINFVQFGFRVNTGDILVHDTVSQKLTVYRGGKIVKIMPQSSLGMSAFAKDGMTEEVVERKPVPQPIDPAETLRMLKLSLPKLKPDLPKTEPKPTPIPLPKKKRPAKIEPFEDEAI